MRTWLISISVACRTLVALALLWLLLVRMISLVEKEVLLEGEIKVEIYTVSRFE